MDTSPDQIRDIAVKVVGQFISNSTPLSDGVADAAKSLGLNSEQVKRIIEATNSIAYLKLLEGSSDRTFEFPVAKYEDVMRSIVMPVNLEQTAVVESSELNKEASYSEEYTAHMSLGEKYVVVFNEMLSNKYSLEKIAYDLQEVGMLIEQSILTLKRDPEGLDKFAEVSNENHYSKVSMLMHGMVKEASDNSVFRDAELKEARNLADLFKQAELLIIEKKSREEMHEKMAGILGAVAKLPGKAIGGVVKGTSYGAGKVAGGVVGAGLGVAGKAVGKVLRKPQIGTNGVPTGKKMFRPGIGGAALAVLGSYGMTAKSGPDVWDALHR